jgi:methylthioribose-1-phosphate isomerase
MLDAVRWEDAGGRIVSAWADGVGLLPGKLRLIDQTLLPGELVYVQTDDLEEIFSAIRRLVVRGAPAIGCAAALGLAAVCQHSRAPDAGAFLCEVRTAADRLRESRPTAVNLFWALDRCERGVRAAAAGAASSPTELKAALLREALTIVAEDIAMCRAIGEHGAALLADGMGVLTHCNAGALATSDYGTALAPIYVAHERGLRLKVFADETRPLLQGARLTAWELARAGVDVTVICDNMAAQVLREGRIQRVIVGADRIAANGDTANKIGTYGVAILARYHQVPLYVAAPSSTFDLALADGTEIPIEQRDGDEIRRGFGHLTTPPDAPVYNPAFDVTPHELIAGIITERGLILPPFREKLRQPFGG